MGKLSAQLIKDCIDGKIRDFAANDTGFELVDVEKRIEHPRHRFDRLVEPVDQPKRALVCDVLRQNALQEAQGLQGLPQIMAGGGEKTGLAEIGLLCLAFGRPQYLRYAPCASMMSSIASRILGFP